MKKFFPILSVLTAIFLAYALHLALGKDTPTDAQQGDVYRIIYYHVPSAWTAFLLFFINFIASIQYLASGKEATRRAANWIVIAVGVIGVIVTYLPQVQEQLASNKMRPSAMATTVLCIPAFYFLVGWLFPGDRVDVLARQGAVAGKFALRRFSSATRALTYCSWAPSGSKPKWRYRRVSKNKAARRSFVVVAAMTAGFRP